jgi:hypothetical protein
VADEPVLNWAPARGGPIPYVRVTLRAADGRTVRPIRLRFLRPFHGDGIAIARELLAERPVGG